MLHRLRIPKEVSDLEAHSQNSLWYQVLLGGLLLLLEEIELFRWRECFELVLSQQILN